MGEDLELLLDPFTHTELNDTVREIPDPPDEIGEFQESETRRPYVKIERDATETGLLRVTWREDTTPDTGEKRDRTKVILEVPKAEDLDKVTPDDISETVQFGAEDQFEQFETFLENRLISGTNSVLWTRTFAKWQSLRGKLVDPASGDELYDFHQILDRPRKAFDLKLGSNENAPIETVFHQMFPYLRANLKGETMTGARVYMGAALFDVFVENAAFKELYFGGEAGKMRRLLNLHAEGIRGFKALDIIRVDKVIPLRSPRGQVTERPLMPPNEGVLIPLGTRDTFRLFNGPDTTIENLRRPPQRLYTSMRTLPHGKGFEMNHRTHFLTVVKRPQLVATVTSSTGLPQA